MLSHLRFSVQSTFYCVDLTPSGKQAVIKCCHPHYRLSPREIITINHHTFTTAMVREDKQLPSPPPEDSKSPYGASKHVKSSSTSSNSSLVKRLASSSSLTSNGQVKRTTYGSTTNGLKKVDPNDDLLILLLAQKAATETQDSNILNPEEIDELKNVSPPKSPHPCTATDDRNDNYLNQ
jgi:hypothetical protein